MCTFIAHDIANFANGHHTDFHSNVLTQKIQSMAFLITIICIFGWFGQALKDGANIK